MVQFYKEFEHCRNKELNIGAILLRSETLSRKNGVLGRSLKIPAGSIFASES